MKVIITERIAQAGIDILREKADVDIKLNISRDELLDAIGQYNAIVVRSSTKVDRELIERGKNLKVIGRAGNGIDNIDLDAATEKGIVVVNTPESNSISAAEHTIGLLLASIRNTPQANSFIKAGNWGRSQFKGNELNGKTVGIIGLGRIGGLVAARLLAFNMKVTAYDPYIPDERFKYLGVEKKDSLEDLLREADIITVHTPKTEETYGMLGEKEFTLMKDGVRLVNCARGGIISERALLKALESGKAASAALDVFEEEPCPDNPLFKLDNTVVTPHLGADTVEAQDNVGITIARQVLNALEGKLVSNAVNMPSLPDRDMEYLKPYMVLAEKLGRLYYQLEKKSVSKVEIKYRGGIIDHKTGPLTLAYLKGLLEPVVKERVNYVNAKHLAKSRGIDVLESLDSTSSEYTDLIEVKVSNCESSFVMAGTLFGMKEPRIVDLNGYKIDMEPSSHMLLVKNDDKPGVIGCIGTIMGVSKINIATMRVSRNVKGGKALMVLNVDSVVPRDVIEMVKKVDGVTEVNFIKL
ncbi:MAG: D-3-phosphoglycerate dehydrogenase [Firmicutes bacterium]|nr:D-3-phosphoglycerate dehydrogenase [Bacillota bacterium]MDI6706898.1 phosphoglycerate dehydrogenase [Bacillota bacterium]